MMPRSTRRGIRVEIYAPAGAPKITIGTHAIQVGKTAGECLP